jgi:hypothetical protein
MPIAFPAPLQDWSAIWAKNVVQKTFDGVPAPNLGNPNYRFSLGTLDGGMGKLLAHSDANTNNPGGKYAAAYMPIITPLSPTVDTVAPATDNRLFNLIFDYTGAVGTILPTADMGVAFPAPIQGWSATWAKNLIQKPFYVVPAPNMANPNYKFSYNTLGGGCVIQAIPKANNNLNNPGGNFAIPYTPFIPPVIKQQPVNIEVILTYAFDATPFPLPIPITGIPFPPALLGWSYIFAKSLIQKPFNYIPAPNLGNPNYRFNSSTLNGGMGKLLSLSIANLQNPGNLPDRIQIGEQSATTPAVPTVNSVVDASIIFTKLLPAYNQQLTGVSRDQYGVPLANCLVSVFRSFDKVLVAETTSDNQGNWQVAGLGTYSGPFFLVEYKAVANQPDLFGTSLRTLVATPLIQ